ncbi:autophagy protein [Coemansia biformis]|uniref:Autophagy protein n=1 Tax=Coemansia biformis TaxID=1286918 RepID=A0A9W7Y3E9_9FUNG|nr:autophagy protein [Coemansia biformis]
MSKATADRCKRCSQQLDYSGPGWSDVSADSVEAVLQTLPPARSQELRAALGAGRGASVKPVELSRFFSNTFRADQVSRLPDGTISPGGASASGQPAGPRRPLAGSMRGSLALVMGSSEQYGREAESRGASDATEAGGAGPGDISAAAAGELGTGNTSSQSDSFILLSSSQLHPQALGADMARLSPTSESASGSGHGPAFDSLLSDKTHPSGSRDSGRQQDDIAATAAIIGRLADGLEARSALSHPMCEECAEVMARLLDREISDSVRERQILEGIGRTAEQIKASTGGGRQMADDVAELEREIEKQAEMERALGDTLGMLDEQLLELCGQIDRLDRESRDMDEHCHESDQRRNELGSVLERCEAEQWALDEKYARLAAQLTQLQRTNVYNDVFNIVVAEGVASINGFRLGGRSSHSVEWAEINAAWGQALLLLQTVARRVGHEFVGFRLIPMGSFSRIERVPEDGGEAVALELFGSGDLYLGRLFQNRRFDAAMVAYLACLDQVAQLIMSLNPQLHMPYRIDQDKVGAVSIKPQFGQDDVWTRACRNTLLNARWALAFASSYTNFS